MNRFACFFILLSFATTPALSTTADKSAAAHPSTAKPVEQAVMTPLQNKVEVTSEGQRSASSHWIAVLKTFFLDISLRNTGRERSWVSGINEEQSLQLAASIADYIAKQVPTVSTILLLAPPKAQANNPLTPALNESLRKSGFAIVDSKRQARDAHVLLYQISRLNGGFLVQLRLNQTEANRFYSLNSVQGLVASAPFSVRQVQ
jgi:hypothetical protein